MKKVCTVRREGTLGQNLSNSGIPERGKGKSTCQKDEKKSNQKAIIQSGNQWCWGSLKLSAVDSYLPRSLIYFEKEVINNMKGR